MSDYEFEKLQNAIDFYYKKLRPSNDLRVFLSLNDKYIRELVKRELEESRSKNESTND